MIPLWTLFVVFVEKNTNIFIKTEVLPGVVRKNVTLATQTQVGLPRKIE